MTLKRISELLSLGEGQETEYKPSARNKDALGKTVCGFLNTSGGYLIYGVDDKGTVTGADASPNAISQLEKLFAEKISPKTFVTVEADEIQEKSVVVIEVPKGKDVPYSFKDVIYIRSGEKTQKADAETIRDIVMRRQVEPERWERRFSLAEIEDDVYVREVQATVTDANKAQRVFFRDHSNTAMVLEDLSAAKYGRLTNGGDVLFTINPAMRHPQIRIKAARFNEDKSDSKFSDMQSFEGPLHRIFEDAYSFIVRNTPSVSRFAKDSPKRQDAALYPKEAVREALINALAHRDYSATSGGVSIYVYPHKLEIQNSGALPEGVTVESLRKGQISVLRNPDIAHVLYLRGLMERIGRGSVMMVNKCREQNLPPPKWESNPDSGVTVTFYTTEATTEATTEVATEATTEVKRLLSKLQGEMSRSEIRDLLGLKNDEHLRKAYLTPALKLGLIERTIPDKPKSPKQKYRLSAVGKKKGAHVYP